MVEDGFWDDQEKAKKIIAQANELKSWIEPFQAVSTSFENVAELVPDALAAEDEPFIEELFKELTKIEEETEELELRKMLSGELDNKSCYLSINAGAGGTESCDWVQMLSRMYQRWCAKKGWKCEIIDLLEGEVAGIKNITMKFIGAFAYGYTKAEKGVHRLVRISPFDSNARRHTSFASVDVIPEIDDDVQVDIRPEDIRVDTYRSSGAGGQHVNTTDSAVRMTHIPTGVVVSSQTERSQIQNRETCLKMLKSKIYEMQLAERAKKVEQLSGEKKEIAWGSQIRSYVFQPYTLVKDARTKYEEGNIEKVMDGELDGFIKAYLKEFG